MMDMIVESAAEETAAKAAARVVLFDFDGVLMRGDAFTAFMRWHLGRSGWRLAACALLMPVLASFLALRPTRMRALGAVVRVALLGLDNTRFERLLDRFVPEFVQRPRIFIRDGIRELRRHMQAGEHVIVVSGCEERLLRRIFDAIGLAEIELISSRLREGRLGMRKQVHNIGRTKPLQLAAYGIESPWDVAYSDSAHDIPMLKGAREAVLVNASEETRQRVARALGQAPRSVNWY
ncbi:MAG: haloacid dehalogenase-like hydrolase [Gammaproteobacteria bacterium]|nr:MAG: haloacid dehalogenase-like hydrolase [Gammaproteobacteria bacterium]